MIASEEKPIGGVSLKFMRCRPQGRLTPACSCVRTPHPSDYFTGIDQNADWKMYWT